MRFVVTKSLQPGMVVARDILGPTPAAVLKRGIRLTQSYIDFLDRKGYIGVYVSDSFSEDVDIQEVVDQQLVREGLEAVQKRNIGDILGVATNIVADIYKQDNISVDLFDLRSYDDYTYHHSVNVGVYCASVGKKLGLTEEEMVYLATAAICHDLGKSRVSEAIIKKEGKLTDEEYEEIKKHSQYSFDILHEDPSVPPVVLQAVIMHHEDEDGRGYPFGKKGEDIPLFAKIIHAMDVYDALTSKRPYKEPFAPSEAIEYINNNKGILFDKKVVAAVNEVIPAYPPGIDVTLSNGEEALVLAHTFHAMRPRIKILETGKVVNLSVDQEYKDVDIVASDIMPQDFAEEVERLNEERNHVRNRKYTVMIVDDEKFSRLVTKEALWGRGYRIIEAGSGKEAIEYIKENRSPDLVLMDIQMPGMDGVKTTKEMRELDEELPIIFLTAHADVDTVVRCKSVDAMDYILKPAGPAYLRKRVDYAFFKIEEHKIRNRLLNETVDANPID
ncbi:MAG: response regulator [Eubacterium sp.]|nr:response regulator [Eubacterium sp.]